MIIGIDLGTTFSVLAVRGRVELADGYPPPTYLDQLDVTIIPDPYGNDVIPSAVWEDPENPGTLVVGTEARTPAGEGQAPIVASKRNIGTDILHSLPSGQYTARQVAAILLGYLKDVAEQALGERVDRAVISHPAFFEGSMMRETAQAARDAGFDFDEDKHLIMEPTAAALAYTGADPRDPLRLLTYDLGGGTFDVTVMERRGGVVTVRAFGGNRLLGGYTFDSRLANWLYERLRERGAKITVDADDPGRYATWVRLMQIAENTKHKLADAHTDRVPVPIRAQLTDDEGRIVTLLDSITRAQYTELIQDLLDETLGGNGMAAETKGCELILAEAGMTIDEVDEVLLVGGSTWGPWVTDAIRRRWNREARLLEPDRIVAAGAARQAAALPAEFLGDGVSVQLDVEPRSPQETITVAGKLGAAEPLSLTLVLTDDGGGRYVASPAEDGRFRFEDVELRPRTTTRFLLTVGEGEHRNLAEHRFDVEQIAEDTEDYGTTAVLTVLPKPLFIEKADGMESLAEEGATLPAHRNVEFQRTNEFDTIEIRLFQEYEPIGAVVIRDVPREAARGSKVSLTVDISRSGKIDGHARVYNRSGTVIREGTVDIEIPRMEIPTLSELREEITALESDLEERLLLGTDASQRLAMRAEGDRLSRKARRLLDSPVPDRQEIWLLVRALDRTVRPPHDEMDPPLAQFEGILLRIRDILAEQGSDSNVQSQNSAVNRLEKQGRTAYSRRQPKPWAQANDGLRQVLYRLERPYRRNAPENDNPPTDAQKTMAIMQLDQLRQELRAKEAELMDRGDFDRFGPRAGRIRLSIDAVQHEIEKISADTAPGAASAQIQLAKHKLRSISEDIRLVDVDVTR